MSDTNTPTTETPVTETPVTEDEAMKAREVVATYERQKQEAVAAAREAYGVPVLALVTSPEYLAVYRALADMMATQSDDSYFGMPVSSLHTIARNLASQVGISLDETPVTTGTPDNA